MSDLKITPNNDIIPFAKLHGKAKNIAIRTPKITVEKYIELFSWLQCSKNAYITAMPTHSKVTESGIFINEESAKEDWAESARFGYPIISIGANCKEYEPLIKLHLLASMSGQPLKTFEVVVASPDYPDERACDRVYLVAVHRVESIVSLVNPDDVKLDKNYKF